jgi:acyl-CoA synthetase (NDP forming)
MQPHEGAKDVDRIAAVSALLDAKSIAIIGASDDASRIGGRPLRYLIEAGFQGEIYPVNPRRQTVQGMPAYASVADVPTVPDVAMLAVPAAQTKAALVECAELGVRVALIASAGFSESGEAGAQLQHELVAIAEEAGIGLLGPNCLGAFNSSTGLYATFATALARGFPEPGPIGVASQSGAYGAHAVHLARERGLGVGAMVTTGNESGIDVADVIAYYAEDPATQVVLAYAEGIQDGRRLVGAFERARATGTRIVFLKVGTSEAGSRAATSHTAALAGADEVFDAVCRQYGVYRATSTEEQMDVVYALARGLAPRGGRLGIVTVSGGAGVHLCDAADRFGLQVPELSASAQERIARQLPYASATNPVDVTAQALQQVDLLTSAFQTVLGSGEVDTVIAYFTTTLLAKVFADVLATSIINGTAERDIVPVVLVMVADPDIVRRFEDEGFWVFEDTERAVQAVAAAEWLVRNGGRGSAGEPPAHVPPGSAAVPGAATILARRFNEYEATQLLGSAGIPMIDQRLAGTPDEAIAAADGLGYPVAIKVCSPDIAHKSDVGGVVLGLADEPAVRAAFGSMLDRVRAAAPLAQIDGVLVSPMAVEGLDFVIGLNRDQDFGMVVMVGVGGVFVEVMNDVSFRVAPVDRTEARRMIDELQSRRLLDGFRGRGPADIDSLALAVSRLSWFGVQHADRLESVEVNPMLVSGSGVVGLDALVVAP